MKKEEIIKKLIQETDLHNEIEKVAINLSNHKLINFETEHFGSAKVCLCAALRKIALQLEPVSESFIKDLKNLEKY